MAAPKGHPRYGGKPKGYKFPKTLAKERAHQKALRAEDITAERVMREIARIAMVDRRSIWDAQGNLKPMHDWSADAGALLEGFEVIVKNAAAGDGHTDTVHKVQLAKKLGALEMLAKHFGLVSERVDVNVTASFDQKVSAARARVAAEKAHRQE